MGQNILATLAGRRERVALVATSSVANEPALFDTDAVYLVPATMAEPEAFERRLLEIVDRERIDLVIPCRDDDVLLLASLRERRPELAKRLLCGSAAAAEVICDKWASHEFSVAHGLPFAASIVASTEDARNEFVRKHGLPLVGKPRRGYASLDVYLLHREEQVATLLVRDGYIVQQFLGDPQPVRDYLTTFRERGIPLMHSFEGLKHSIQALIGPEGSIVHVICTRNVRYMRRSKWVRPDADPASRDIGMRCARAFAAIGWRGPLNIQCAATEPGEILIHEFNGRFTGGTVDRWLLGYDEVGAAVEAFTGHPFPSDRIPATAALESFQSRVARAADPAKVAVLARDGEWRRPA